MYRPVRGEAETIDGDVKDEAAEPYHKEVYGRPNKRWSHKYIQAVIDKSWKTQGDRDK